MIIIIITTIIIIIIITTLKSHLFLSYRHLSFYDVMLLPILLFVWKFILSAVYSDSAARKQ